MIGGEKAGIIEPGCPVVYAKGDASSNAVIERTAADLGCECVCVSRDEAEVTASGLTGSRIRVNGAELTVPLIGAHQIENAMLAASAARICGASDAAVANGIAAVHFAARMELIDTDRPIILDGAHNPAGARALASAVRDNLYGRRITAIMGMLADKDHAAAVSVIAPLCDYIVTVAPPVGRALSASKLAADARRYCDDVTPSRAIAESIRIADRKSDGGALLVCGSLYLASAIRPKLIRYAEKNQ